MPVPSSSDKRAVRAAVAGRVQAVGFRDATVHRAIALGVLGWVRNADDDGVLVHAEGDDRAVESLLGFLREGPPSAAVTDLTVESVKPEGHEQFAIRGVSAGRFIVAENRDDRGGFELGLELGAGARFWAVPKGPSLDPAVKRMAIELPDSERSGSVLDESVAWDRGLYEQGGRVPWPEALERGHAVFGLHGRKLRGGFALQRTREGEKPQWLLIKRRDDDARPGSDVVAELPDPIQGSA